MNGFIIRIYFVTSVSVITVTPVSLENFLEYLQSTGRVVELPYRCNKADHSQRKKMYLLFVNMVTS